EQVLFKPRMQLFADVVHLVETAERHWHGLERVDRRLDFRKTCAAQEAGIEIASLHQSHHVGLATLRAIGKNRQSNGAARHLAPFFSHGHQAFVIRRSARRESAQAEGNRFVGSPQVDIDDTQPERQQTSQPNSINLELHTTIYVLCCPLDLSLIKVVLAEWAFERLGRTRREISESKPDLFSFARCEEEI